MRMSEEDLADNFDWRSESGCICGGMTSKVMGAQIHTHHFARLVNHHPSSIAGDGENTLLRFNPFILDIYPIDGVANVIEKGFETGVAVSFCGLLGSLGEPGQERQDFIRGDGFQFPITRFIGEPGEKKVMVFQRIFFFELAL